MAKKAAAPAVVPTSNMAIVSLAAGVLGLTLVPFIGSIVAVITGPMARNEIKESKGTLEGDGLALAGLILGWVGIGLTAFALCMGGLFIILPFCVGLLAIGTEGFSALLPLLIAI
jgi:hypothetical protein